MNCLQPCLLKYYWGASIHELHTEMQQPWPDLQRKMALDELMYGAYLQSAPISLYPLSLHIPNQDSIEGQQSKCIAGTGCSLKIDFLYFLHLMFCTFCIRGKL